MADIEVLNRYKVVMEGSKRVNQATKGEGVIEGAKGEGFIEGVRTGPKYQTLT